MVVPWQYHASNIEIREVRQCPEEPSNARYTRSRTVHVMSIYCNALHPVAMLEIHWHAASRTCPTFKVPVLDTVGHCNQAAQTRKTSFCRPHNIRQHTAEGQNLLAAEAIYTITT
jgi:hypothetical protein